MRLGRKGRIVLLSVAAVAAAGALTAYILASSVPSYYRPARLTVAGKDAAMREFRRRLMDFNNDGQKNEPFNWTVTQEQLNRYLDSMDEIAIQGGAKPGSGHRAMESVGLAEPAVVLDGGHVRLIAKSLQYQKVVSMDLSLAIGPDSRLRVSLAGARIGQLPMPKSLVRSLVDRLRAKFVQRPGGEMTAPAISGLDSSQVALVLQRVISAIDGEPIATEMTWRITTRKRVRVTRIDIDAGRLTLHMVPVLRPEENGRQVPIE
jgi:hypothetical protein